MQLQNFINNCFQSFVEVINVFVCFLKKNKKNSITLFEVCGMFATNPFNVVTCFFFTNKCFVVCGMFATNYFNALTCLDCLLFTKTLLKLILFNQTNKLNTAYQ